MSLPTKTRPAAGEHGLVAQRPEQAGERPETVAAARHVIDRRQLYAAVAIHCFLPYKQTRAHWLQAAFGGSGKGGSRELQRLGAWRWVVFGYALDLTGSWTVPSAPVAVREPAR